MELNQAISDRRAYRALVPHPVSDETVRLLAEAASLAPSCFNHQPWRFVFARDKKSLSPLLESMSSGNGWARQASMIVAVVSHRPWDCQVKGRDYYLFDVGIASAHLILKATEMGMVAHPIAGYDEIKAKAALHIPDELTLITLIVMGSHAVPLPDEMNAKDRDAEENRPPRLPLIEIMRWDTYESAPDRNADAKSGNGR